MVLWLVSAHRIKKKWCCSTSEYSLQVGFHPSVCCLGNLPCHHGNKSRLTCWMARDIWSRGLHHPSWPPYVLSQSPITCRITTDTWMRPVHTGYPSPRSAQPVLWPVNSWTLNKMVAVLSYQVWGMVCYAARANCYSPLFRFTFHGFCRNLFFPTYKDESIVWIYLQLIVIRVSDGKKDESAKVPVIMKQQSGWVGKTWQITIMKGENNKDHKGVMNIRKWHSEKKTCC